MQVPVPPLNWPALVRGRHRDWGFNLGFAETVDSPAREGLDLDTRGFGIWVERNLAQPFWISALRTGVLNGLRTCTAGLSARSRLGRIKKVRRLGTSSLRIRPIVSTPE